MIFSLDARRPERDPPFRERTTLIMNPSPKRSEDRLNSRSCEDYTRRHCCPVRENGSTACCVDVPQVPKLKLV
jgi:hypothetical protein